MTTPPSYEHAASSAKKPTTPPETPADSTYAELEIESLEAGGRGIARMDGKVVFVRGALPGQRVRACLTHNKKTFAEGYAVEVCRRAPDEIPAPCAHADVCGGCPLQRLPYIQQIDWKQRFVQDALTRIGHLDCVAHELLPAPAPWFYRNKMEFAFAPDEHGVMLGLRSPQSHEVFPVPYCRLQSRKTAIFVARVTQVATASGIPAWDSKSRQGLRYAVIREFPDASVSIEVILAPHPKSRELGYALVEAFRDVPECIQILVSSRKSSENIAYGERQIFRHGQELSMPLGSMQLSMGAASFFQVSNAGCELLYETAARYADVQEHERIWDLYGGVGGLGLWAGRHCAGITGIEQVQEAAEYAAKNYQRWARCPENCHSVHGDVHALKKLEKPDVVLLDPPRAGADPQLISSLCNCGAERIIYVSCDPVSMSRDLALLNSHYTISDVQPVDIFPQTAHIECVARLTRRTKKA